MAHMANQTSQYATLQTGGATNPLDSIVKHMDTVPHMIYGTLMIVIITFHDQLGPTLARYADMALGRVLGIGLVLLVTSQMGWTYGLLTAIAFLLLVHGSPRLAATGSENFEDLKRQEAKGTVWFVEKVLGENPEGITTDSAQTRAVQDDSQRTMSHGR
jgi:hypothetical protein